MMPDLLQLEPFATLFRLMLGPFFVWSFVLLGVTWLRRSLTDADGSAFDRDG